MFEHGGNQKFNEKVIDLVWYKVTRTFLTMVEWRILWTRVWYTKPKCHEEDKRTCTGTIPGRRDRFHRKHEK